MQEGGPVKGRREGSNAERGEEMRRKLVGFKSRKAAQIAAFFANIGNGSIKKLKLAKLIYLAEREFLYKYKLPMLFDEFYSLPHGPVCSNALDGINGRLDKKEWDEFIRRHGVEISCRKPLNRSDADQISDAEYDVLNSVWSSFGWMNASEIRNYTHKNCPEYQELNSGRLPISYEDVFKALGFLDEADSLANNIADLRRLDSLFS